MEKLSIGDKVEFDGIICTIAHIGSGHIYLDIGIAVKEELIQTIHKIK